MMASHGLGSGTSCLGETKKLGAKQKRQTIFYPPISPPMGTSGPFVNVLDMS